MCCGAKAQHLLTDKKPFENNVICFALLRFLAIVTTCGMFFFSRTYLHAQTPNALRTTSRNKVPQQCIQVWRHHRSNPAGEWIAATNRCVCYSICVVIVLVAHSSAWSYNTSRGTITGGRLSTVPIDDAMMPACMMSTITYFYSIIIINSGAHKKRHNSY